MAAAAQVDTAVGPVDMAAELAATAAVDMADIAAVDMVITVTTVAMAAATAARSSIHAGRVLLTLLMKASQRGLHLILRVNCSERHSESIAGAELLAHSSTSFHPEASHLSLSRCIPHSW